MRLISLFALCFVACSTASRPEIIAVSHKDGPQNPLGVRIEQRSLETGEAELWVTFRRLATVGDVQLQVVSPDGVRVVGVEHGRVLGANESGQWQVPVRVQWTSDIPSTDLTIRLFTESAGFKASASGVYRFGRPEPQAPHVAFSPSPVQLGRLTVRDSVMMDSLPLADGDDHDAHGETAR